MTAYDTIHAITFMITVILAVVWVILVMTLPMKMDIL